MEKEIVPTAEAFCKTFKPSGKTWQENFHETMIEFAKLHVEAALKAAEKSNFINAEGISISPKSNNLHWTAYGNVGKITYNKDSILNAYPLDNIK